MNQSSFSDLEYSLRKRRTKREECLRIMKDIIPWHWCPVKVRGLRVGNPGYFYDLMTVIEAAQFERLSFPCDFNNMIGLDRAALATERPHLYF